MTGFFDQVVDIVKEDEGFRSKPYLDSNGVLTIGWGTNIAQGIDHTEATFFLEHRLGLAMRDCIRRLPWFGRLDEVRRGVVLRMAYQLGVDGVLGFRKFCAAMAAGNWNAAADEMLDSKWAREDSPARAHREARRMREGA
jgi:lysozyme